MKDFLLEHAETIISVTAALIIRFVEKRKMKKRFSMNGQTPK